ncbi:WxL domain-containing protein [Candidatus Enterococcus murrayae]|uniref:WxL domain-containing protein n=1 Tax=Candidatus Enterococcus murrayae TaxID=2815321 RepID=A0ABS3HJP7_9ENTE|nr:WxL domain-containing protein [Enterococcus sp. MJM16]MBO0453687.1 WxL domain-containing protein [Enterococcus sp. MJM16]
MRSLIRNLFVVVVVLSGIGAGSLSFPEQSIAVRTNTFTGKIDFNMYMDDGSQIPAGKVPTAQVDYGVRRDAAGWKSDNSYVGIFDDFTGLKTITIPYNGSGNFSASEVTTWTYGWDMNPPSPYTERRDTRFHSFHKLRFTNVPSYIRTISAKSTVLGDYSQYTQEYDVYEGPRLTSNLAFNRTEKKGNIEIRYPELTRVASGIFSYQGYPELLPSEEHPNAVEFTISGGRAGANGPHLWNEIVFKNSSVAASGKKITFFMKGFRVMESFVDETGVTLTPPTGFTQGKTTDVKEEQYTHSMSKLPTSYITGGDGYVLQGWYQGPTKPGTLNTTNPPSPTIDYTQSKSIQAFDDEGKITVVYEKRKLHALQEKYIDSSDTSINSGSWDTTDAVADGSNFTGAPAANKTDSLNTDWEYTGWKEGISGPLNNKSVPVSLNNITGNKDIYYIYKKKQHTITEKWVNQSDGSTLVPMAGNPKTSTMDDNDNFTGTASATVTDTGGDVWDYVGWENVTDAPGTVNPSPSYAVNNVKGAKEIRYHYQARSTTASLDLTPTPQIVANNGSVAWSSRLTNTGTSTLNNLTLKATSNWASGLSTPTQVTVTPAGGAPMNIAITPADWVGGFSLTGISIPNAGPNNYADITFTDTATGAVNQVLPAEIEIDGNIATPLTAENFVRIDDPDEPNLKPIGNAGLINIPNFKFGDVEVKPTAQKKELDAASYEAGYKPYIRFMDNESNFGWDLTVKLGQFTSGSKTLPTTTAISLRNGVLMDVQNYNKHNESFGLVKTESTKVIPSDGTTVALTDHSGRGVYHLEYGLNHVELELLAHSGIAGLKYEADMDWTLTTAP